MDPSTNNWRNIPTETILERHMSSEKRVFNVRMKDWEIRTKTKFLEYSTGEMSQTNRIAQYGTGLHHTIQPHAALGALSLKNR